MSFTHTLSIQGVHATLQMIVEQSVVRYTLTLRADSGEESVANGRLPNDAVDNFIVINQHFTNPEPAKCVGGSLSSEVKQTMEQGIQTSLAEIIQKNTYLPVIPEDKMQHSHSSITMLFDIPCDTESIEESVVESFSPILPSSPKHVDDTNFAQYFEQELQDLSNKKFAQIEEPQMTNSLQPEHMIQVSGEETIQLRPVEQEKPTEPASSFNQTAMIEQLEKLRQYTNLRIKQGIIQAAYQHLEDNNIAIWQYPLLQEYMMKLFYELLVVHVNDIILRDECIKMLYLVGAEDLPDYLKHITSEYNLLYKVGKYYKLNVSEESLLGYWNWKKSYNGPSLHRWNMMKTYLYQRK